LAAEAPTAKPVAADSGEGSGGPPEERIGDFEGAFAAAPVKLDERYTTADESHAMMEPHATIAAWDGRQAHRWTSNQMIAWARAALQRCSA
jgi:xanthine dehydrogenase YagR molybdenum-binding subunit